MGRVILTRETEITPPARLPLDVEYVRTHLRSITASEDTLIESWIGSAGLYFREMTGRELITTTRELWLDAWPSGSQVIELPRPPLQSVLSVQHLVDGSLVDFNDGGSPAGDLHLVIAPAGPYARPGYIMPPSSGVWPSVVSCVPGSVRIRYTCGYGDTPADIPDLVKTALCGLIGTFDQYRSEIYTSERGSMERLPFGIDLMMDGFKSSALRTTVPTWG